MSRQFENEYSRTNDRIHPRKDLLQEMEAKWAAEEAERAAKERKVVSFPVWARFMGVAAGIVLCVGLGIGSVMLFSRGRVAQNKTASAEASMMAADSAMEQPEEKILFEAPEAEEAAEDMVAGGAAPETMLTAVAAANEVPQGMHFAADEAEVEDAVLYGSADRGEARAAEAKAAEAVSEAGCPNGKIIRRDDLFAVFLPTLEQIHVIQYANRKISNVFALTLREQGAQVRDVFWLGGELLAVRERNGETELLRFNVASWSSPKHLLDLTQNGSFLGAWEMGGRLFILSLHEASDEEPLPWVSGERMDYASVLLDAEKPGNAFAVLTIYEPGQGDGFAAQIALLATVQGAVDTGDGRLLLWTKDGELYELALGVHGLVLTSQSAEKGTVLDAGPLGEGFSLLMQNGDDAELLTLDAELTETSRATAPTAGPVRWGQVYEDGAVFLTADALHFLTKSGDHILNVTGDAFCWLTPDRGLVLSADGQLQVVSVLGTGLEALGSANIRGGLGTLLEDLSRLAFDRDTGRLAIPAGQNVYQYIIDEAGKITLRGETQVFSDHKGDDQRELRILLFENQALIFHKSGVALCNQYLARQSTSKY